MRFRENKNFMSAESKRCSVAAFAPLFSIYMVTFL